MSSTHMDISPYMSPPLGKYTFISTCTFQIYLTLQIQVLLNEYLIMKKMDKSRYIQLWLDVFKLRRPYPEIVKIKCCSIVGLCKSIGSYTSLFQSLYQFTMFACGYKKSIPNYKINICGWYNHIHHVSNNPWDDSHQWTIDAML